jgi:hypothetical protein
MNIDEWVYTFGIAIGLLAAYGFGITAYKNGKRGKNFSDPRLGDGVPGYTEMDVNTAETSQQIVHRSSKSIAITVLALLVCWFLSELKSADNVDWERGAIVLLGLTILVPYISGVKKAYDSAKIREERGITRLQELRAAPSLFRSHRRIVFYTDKTMLAKNYSGYEGYFGQLLNNSKAFFKDGQDGDLIFIFNTALYKGSDPTSRIVIYRKDADTIVKTGEINYQIKDTTAQDARTRV